MGFARRVRPGELEAALRGVKSRAGLPSCADLEKELRAGEVAALNLDTRRRWFRCSANHGYHCACEKEIAHARHAR